MLSDERLRLSRLSMLSCCCDDDVEIVEEPPALIPHHEHTPLRASSWPVPLPLHVVRH